MALIAEEIWCALVFIGITSQRATRAKRFAAQLKEVIAHIGSTEGGLNHEGGVVN